MPLLDRSSAKAEHLHLDPEAAILGMGSWGWWSLMLRDFPEFEWRGDDAYVNSAAATTNYGAATTLNLSSAADTAFVRFDLTAVPATYTGSSVAKATMKLYVNTVTTAGSFNAGF